MAVPTGNLWCWYRFETSTIGLDSSGSGHNATYYGPPTSAYAGGKHGLCLQLDSGDWLDPYYTSLGTNLAFSFWFKRDALAGSEQQLLAYGWEGGGAALLVSINGANIYFGSGGTPASYAYDYAGLWTHICIQYNGTQRKGYVNGSLVSTVTESLSFGTTYHVYGRRPGYPNYFSGYLDSIRLYQRELSDSEVADLYNEVDTYFVDVPTANTITVQGNAPTTLPIFMGSPVNIAVQAITPTVVGVQDINYDFATNMGGFIARFDETPITMWDQGFEVGRYSTDGDPWIPVVEPAAQSALLNIPGNAYLNYRVYGILQIGDPALAEKAAGIIDAYGAIGNDQRAFAIADWVGGFLRFANNYATWGKEDFWVYPTHLLRLGFGDWDDAAHLIHALWLAAGVEGFRCRTLHMEKSDRVDGHGVTAMTVAAYKRELDEQWVYVEWENWAGLVAQDIGGLPMLNSTTVDTAWGKVFYEVTGGGWVFRNTAVSTFTVEIANFAVESPGPDAEFVDATGQNQVAAEWSGPLWAESSFVDHDVYTFAAVGPGADGEFVEAFVFAGSMDSGYAALFEDVDTPGFAAVGPGWDAEFTTLETASLAHVFAAVGPCPHPVFTTVVVESFRAAGPAATARFVQTTTPTTGATLRYAEQ